MELKKYLNKWEFKKVIRGEFHPWENEFLELPEHEIHASLDGKQLEILLNETKEQDWTFRRDPRITYPLHSVWSLTKTGIPYLNPEIALLYKAKNTREKDHQDFMNIKDYLHPEQKQWLRNALEIHEPEHKWIELI